MLWRLLRADLRRSRGVSITLAILILFAALLSATSASLMARTFVALDGFWEQAKPADTVQMHAGELDEDEIASWMEGRDDVEDFHVMKTLPVPGGSLTIAGQSQADSVLEPALVTAPERFDLLVDAEGTPVQPAPGEVWLPVHYQAEDLAKVGDPVTITLGTESLDLQVAGFARDSQMNPSMVTSKRFVVNATNFAKAEPHLEPEYLIETKLADGASVKEVQDAYADAGLPARGVAVDASIFRLMNALSVLLIAATMLLVSLILIAVTIVALRLANLAAVENDIAEIAALKVIGAPVRGIKRIYLTKYAALAIVGSVLGLLLSWPLANVTSSQITTYLGQPSTSIWLWLAPVLGTLLVIAIVVGSCWQVLGRIGKMSGVEALRTGSAAGSRRTPRWRLVRSRLAVPDFLGVQGAFSVSNGFLALVVALCAFVMIVPASVATTLQNSRFATFLGVGEADVRIDVRDSAGDIEAIASDVAEDPRVTRSVSLVSARFEIKGADGAWESVVIETGDHEVFPLNYESGRAPQNDGEIALSVNEADAVGAAPEQNVEVKVGDDVRTLQVSGIYQDITNGGKTAKARFDLPGEALWQVVYAETDEEASIAPLTADLAAAYPGAKITDVQGYAAETMGGTVSQMRLVSILAAAAGVGVAFLIVALFGILVLARQRGQIAVLRGIGASLNAIRRQYTVQFGLVIIVGVVLGLILANTLGQLLFAAALGSLGAPGVVLMPARWLSWLVLPLILAAGCAAAVLLALRRVRTIQIAEQE